MNNSIFCPECRMLKTNCICSKSSKSKGKSRFQNKKEINFSKEVDGNTVHYKLKSRSKSENSLKSKPKNNSKSKPKNNSKLKAKNNLKSKSKSGLKSKAKNNPKPNSKNNLKPKSKSDTSKKTRIKNLKKKYPDIDNRIIENFPFDEPRKDQFETISEISKAIDEGYKYIVLEAGTGTGKSVMAATLAKIYSPAFILTMTKQLQNQYLKDFEKDGFTLVKGRNNFDCKEKELYSGDKGIRCDNGTCTERYSFNCKFKFRPVDLDVKTNLEHAFRNMYWKSDIHCNFLEQKVDGINSDVVIANYDYAMLELNYVEDFIKRKLLILDEAHNLEKKIMRFIELEIDRKRLESEIKIKVSNDEIENLHKVGHDAWISFVKSIIKRYQKEVIEYEAKLKSATSKSKKLSYEGTAKDLADELDKYERFIIYIEDDSGNWILEDNAEFIYFKPLKIDKYAKEYLFQYGEICLFLSATILDYKNFSKWLGLNEKDVKFIQVDTPFKASKRPIDISRSVDMNYEKLRRNAPKTIDFIKEILEKHKDDKGLIHTVSYKCSDFISKNLNDSRIISHKSSDRMRVLNQFEKSKKPLVLLSPSMNEGVDLPYDKCRFQIIYKIPFPPIMDKQIGLRKTSDRYWYPYQTMMNLVQTYGRGMRAEDDYCQTYVIDSRLKFYAYNSPLYRRLVPKFFKEAIVDSNKTN
ncbi:MAG: ATP-dependent DNA helicase [Methanobrevibacter sp.]|nr:ATP-dependent DNA helicase [Methanobrevibacter sp.]